MTQSKQPVPVGIIAPSVQDNVIVIPTAVVGLTLPFNVTHRTRVVKTVTLS